MNKNDYCKNEYTRVIAALKEDGVPIVKADYLTVQLTCYDVVVSIKKSLIEDYELVKSTQKDENGNFIEYYHKRGEKRSVRYNSVTHYGSTYYIFNFMSSFTLKALDILYLHAKQYKRQRLFKFHRVDIKNEYLPDDPGFFGNDLERSEMYKQFYAFMDDQVKKSTKKYNIWGTESKNGYTLYLQENKKAEKTRFVFKEKKCYVEVEIKGVFLEEFGEAVNTGTGSRFVGLSTLLLQNTLSDFNFECFSTELNENQTKHYPALIEVLLDDPYLFTSERILRKRTETDKKIIPNEIMNGYRKKEALLFQKTIFEEQDLLNLDSLAVLFVILLLCYERIFFKKNLDDYYTSLVTLNKPVYTNCLDRNLSYLSTLEFRASDFYKKLNWPNRNQSFIRLTRALKHLQSLTLDQVFVDGNSIQYTSSVVIPKFAAISDKKKGNFIRLGINTYFFTKSLDEKVFVNISLYTDFLAFLKKKKIIKYTPNYSLHVFLCIMRKMREKNPVLDLNQLGFLPMYRKTRKKFYLFLFHFLAFLTKKGHIIRFEVEQCCFNIDFLEAEVFIRLITGKSSAKRVFICFAGL